MTFLLVVLIILVAFFVGYSLGLSGVITNKKTTKYSRSGMSEKEKREYENFLNYDGSEQL